MKPILIVINAPVLDDLSGLIEAHEPVLVQAFIAESAVKAFHVAVIDRFPWPNKLKLDPAFIRPSVKGVADKLRAVIDDDLNKPLGSNLHR